MARALARAAATAAATLLLAAALLVAAAPPAAAGPAERGVAYRPPVDAPVTDPFRPPPHPYGPGNRGLEHATRPGAVVRAAAGGIVGFAGRVAGTLWVSVDHPDGVRTTYGPLGRATVRRGARVAAGEPVGLAGGRLLWTARIGGAYVDPAELLAASGPVAVRLVPAGRAGTHEAGTPTRRTASRCASAAKAAEPRWGACSGDD